MELGIARFVTPISIARSHFDNALVSPIRSLLEEATLADEAGLSVFNIGEHHSSEFIDSAPTVLLAAVAARTQRIRVASGVTVLSAADPVRIFEEFATLDQISEGRAEIIVGRGAYAETFSLFGVDGRYYDQMFAEKLSLLLQIREKTNIHWSGQFRAPLQGQGVYPRPIQQELPIWLGVGGTPSSAERAGTIGMPLALGIIGGSFERLRPLVEIYRRAGRKAGHADEKLRVGINALGFVAETRKTALTEFYPAYAEIFGPIGQRIGWPPLNFSLFESLCADTEALIVGNPTEVQKKINSIDQMLGGISRLTLQMSLGSMSLDQRLRSIIFFASQPSIHTRPEQREKAPL